MMIRMWMQSIRSRRWSDGWNVRTTDRSRRSTTKSIIPTNYCVHPLFNSSSSFGRVVDIGSSSLLGPPLVVGIPSSSSSLLLLLLQPPQRRPTTQQQQYRTIFDMISSNKSRRNDDDDDDNNCDSKAFTTMTTSNSTTTAPTPVDRATTTTSSTNTNMNTNTNTNTTGSTTSGTTTNPPPRRVWDREAVADLFSQYAKVYQDGIPCLNCDDIRSLLRGIGVVPNDTTISKLFSVADNDQNGHIDLEEFLDHADMFLGDNPARIILIVGGPGSGKGLLSKRLMAECNVVHLSSGDLLRQEVALQTNLGRTVRDIMSRGELVSSAIMVALMKKRMKDHPGKRVLLDGFPRSIENAHDLVTLCGQPELALHLNCDDTILMERIMGRGASSDNTPQQVRREDDNFQSALQRLRTFHKYHHSTMEWLREQHVPIVNLDCSGSAESVWQQLVAIGRLMRPAVKIPIATTTTANAATTTTSTSTTVPNTNTGTTMTTTTTSSSSSTASPNSMVQPQSLSRT